MAEPFEKRTYYAMTLDPVHIGTGGYRLGRVDNTITREPGTNLPKIPGSSIAGATRAYTAMAVQNEITGDVWEKRMTGEIFLKEDLFRKMKYQKPKYKVTNGLLVPDIDDNPSVERDKDEKEIYDSCAGKGGDGGDSHCGEPDCEVCVPFGFSRKSGTSFQGLAQFYDARILYFPVHSMIGPVWITSPSVLAEFGKDVFVKDENFKAINREYTQSLNLGWLMLQPDTSSQTEVDLSFLGTCEVCKTLKERLFLVSNKLFSRIVNDNLEVRTSVAIDPATGAAEHGALYTYEAIPRATVMWFDVVYNKPEYFRIGGKDIMKDTGQKANVEWVESCVKKGLPYLETLGVGGMNTRGMGRLKILNLGGA